jgi:hypothetical protein
MKYNLLKSLGVISTSIFLSGCLTTTGSATFDRFNAVKEQADEKFRMGNQCFQDIEIDSDYKKKLEDYFPKNNKDPERYIKYSNKDPITPEFIEAVLSAAGDHTPCETMIYEGYLILSTELAQNFATFQTARENSIRKLIAGDYKNIGSYVSDRVQMIDEVKLNDMKIRQNLDQRVRQEQELTSAQTAQAAAAFQQSMLQSQLQSQMMLNSIIRPTVNCRSVRNGNTLNTNCY